jgi:signal transduction histidine kinase
MPVSRDDARLWDAIRLTCALWVFVILLYIPIIANNHAGEGWFSMALDISTMFVSIAFAMLLFVIYRSTIIKPPAIRFVALSAAMLAIVLGQSFFDFLFTGFVAQNIVAAWQEFPRDLAHNYGGAFNYLCVFGANLALFHLAYQHRCGQRQIQSLTDARSAAQQAQLMALRFQLNPHFLFNTLNSISSMIMTKRNADAELMTERLSSFLRASLSSDPTELVPLGEEFALIEEYLDIETVRFEERLSVEICCSPEAAIIPVPSFLLQPLVENAVKYGVNPSPDPVLVRIDGRCEGNKLVITVQDDGRFSHETTDRAGTGVGLANIRRRLDTLYGGRSMLDTVSLHPGFAAVIRLPIGPLSQQPPS